MTFHFGVNIEDGFEPPLTWQNEVWMDDCVLEVEVITFLSIFTGINEQVNILHNVISTRCMQNIKANIQIVKYTILLK